MKLLSAHPRFRIYSFILKEPQMEKSKEEEEKSNPFYCYYSVFFFFTSKVGVNHFSSMGWRNMRIGFVFILKKVTFTCKALGIIIKLKLCLNYVWGGSIPIYFEPKSSHRLKIDWASTLAMKLYA